MPLALLEQRRGGGFRWQDGTLTDLSSIGGPDSAVVDINDDGQVLVTAGDGGGGTEGWRDFLWNDGVATEINVPGKDYFSRIDINNSGQVLLGVVTEDEHRRAMLWEDGSLSDLGEYTAFNINDLGQIALCTEEGLFLWEEGETTKLLDGWQDGGYLVWDMNDSGQMVGQISHPDYFHGHPFFYADGRVTDLYPSGTGAAVVHAVNNIGQAVGCIDSTNGGAVLWENGQTYHLNELMPADSGWQLSIGYDINDSGQIVGDGMLNGKPAGFLLTPVR